MNLIEQAQLLATQRHVIDNRQLYGNILPYTHHLQDVANVLRRFGITDEVMIAAAWCHDLIEDTRGKPNELRARDLAEMLGEEVASLVEAVTSEDGPNRKVRNALTYPKIREAGPNAIYLKLADRIANVEHSGRARKMYAKEHAEFRHALYDPRMLEWENAGPPRQFVYRSDMARMWEHLDKLITEIKSEQVGGDGK